MQPIDFDLRPFIVIWEPTRACDLACVHCRAAAQPRPSPWELTTAEGLELIDQVAALQPRVFVITGGDPLKRSDVYRLIEYASLRGLHPALTPSATPLLTSCAIDQLKEAGLSRLAVSLDGSTAAIHDGVRRVAGSFDRTIDAILHARAIGIPVQINATVMRANLDDLPNLIELAGTLDIAMLSVFALVPTGRGKASDMITAEEFEKLFALLHETSQRVSFGIKTTEAMHYRRFVLQRRAEENGFSIRDLIDPASGTIDPSALFITDTRRPPIGIENNTIPRAPRGVNDGKGFVFISHLGDVYPSGFLPLAAGNIRKEKLSAIYRHSDLFVSLRDSSLLKGKCGVCEFRELCGGSRARAYALTGDAFASDPLCVYQPASANAQRAVVSQGM